MTPAGARMPARRAAVRRVTARDVAGVNRAPACRDGARANARRRARFVAAARGILLAPFRAP
jgi:hypothetical protein